MLDRVPLTYLLIINIKMINFPAFFENIIHYESIITSNIEHKTSKLYKKEIVSHFDISI